MPIKPTAYRQTNKCAARKIPLEEPHRAADRLQIFAIEFKNKFLESMIILSYWVFLQSFIRFLL